MADNRFDIVGKKLFFYLEEVKALKDGGLWYFFGFSVLLLVFIPFLIIELLILLLTGKDIGWFQSSERVDKEMVLDANEVPESLRHLVPLAEKWGIGDDVERGEFMDSATRQELDELEKYVGPKMQEIGDWLSSYPEGYYSDTTYFFTYLMVSYDEADMYNEQNNAESG